MKRGMWLVLLAGGLRAAETNEVFKLAPPYAELPPSFWEQHGVVVILGVVGGAVLIAGLLWLALRPKPVPPVPLEIQTRNALAALQSRTEDGVLLSELSQVLRRYFIGAFGLPPAELTTTEFCGQLGRNEAVGGELASAVGEFMRACDQRKFALAEPVPSAGAVAKAQELFERAEARRQVLTAALAKTSA